MSEEKIAKIKEKLAQIEQLIRECRQSLKGETT